jgi:hypothetical protein
MRRPKSVTPGNRKTAAAAKSKTFGELSWPFQEAFGHLSEVELDAIVDAARTRHHERRSCWTDVGDRGYLHPPRREDRATQACNPSARRSVVRQGRPLARLRRAALSSLNRWTGLASMVQGRRIRRTRWIRTDRLFVPVEVEAVVPDADATEPVFEPQTVERLREIEKHVIAGDVDWLATRHVHAYPMLQSGGGLRIDDMQGELRVEGREDLLRRLRSVRRGDYGAFMLTHEHEESDRGLFIMINKDVAHLYFTLDEYAGQDSFQPIGMTPPGCPEQVHFLQTTCTEADFDIEKELLVSTDVAYGAAAEFLESPNPPLCVRWDSI